jgi:hypothetical protein
LRRVLLRTLHAGPGLSLDGGRRQFPFQEGSRLNAAGINYTTLKAAAAMKRLQELESLGRPRN